MKKISLKIPKYYNLFELLVILILIYSRPVQGQVPNQIHNLNAYKDSYGWFNFGDSIFVRRDSFFEDYKSYFGLGENDSMGIRSFEYDSFVSGLYHVTYQQFHQGYPIEHAIFKLHCVDGMVRAAHGKIYANPNYTITCTIDPDSALNKIKAYLVTIHGADSFPWETRWEDSIKVSYEDTDATWKPSGIEGFYKTYQSPYLFSNYVYGYKYRVHWFLDTVLMYGEYLVGSCDTNIYDFGTPIQLSNNADGNLYYYGSKSFANETLFGKFYLKDKTRGQLIKVGTQQNNTTFGNVNTLTDADGHWGDREQPSTTALWAIQNIWDHWINEYKRLGSDGNGRKVLISTSADNILNGAPSNFVPPNNPNLPNEFKNLDLIHLGTQMVSGVEKNCVNIQIVGHEYTHAVIEHTCQLTKDDIEPFSIMEGICDAMAIADLFYATGTKNYKLDEIGKLFRDPTNPHNIAAVEQGPEYYLENNYWGGNTTQKEIQSQRAHRNSTVVSRWFYLLGEGTTTPINGVTISGISINKSSKILARAVIHYLTSNSQFTDLRNATIQSAIDLFGDCSNEVVQVRNAWTAVHVGNAVPGCMDVAANHRLICTERTMPSTIIVTANATIANSTSGITYSNWSLPTGWSGSASGNVYTITSYSITSPAVVSVQASKTINGTTFTTSGQVTIYMYNCGGFSDGPEVLSSSNCCDKNLNIFPNPVYEGSKITIQDFNNNWDYFLFDQTGRLIKKLDSTDTKIDNCGMYYLRIEDSQKHVIQTTKILVLRGN